LFKEIKPTPRKNFPGVHSDPADLYVYYAIHRTRLVVEDLISELKTLHSKYLVVRTNG
jgi:hypothetical protein